jgi:NitT/TauT family transport system substrate-binding protein
MHPLQSQFDMSDPAADPVFRRRRSCLAAAALMPLLWSAGCTPAKPLVLVGHPWPGYEPMFLARTLGYMPENLTLREAPTVHDSIDDMKQGRADGAMLTLDEVLQLRAHGTPLEIVLVFDISKGADVLLARPGITQLGALKGKRIGVEDSALGTLMLTMILQESGLQLSDVTPKRVVYEEHEAAWARGDLDALVTYEPVAGRLKARGARQLLSTREMPDTIFDVLAVRPDVARTHASTLRAALTGHFRALRYLRQNPWDAAYRVAPRLGVTAEEMIASLRGLELPDLVGNQRYLSGGSGELLRVANKLSPIMQRANVIARPVDTDELFSSAYLPGEEP